MGARHTAGCGAAPLGSRASTPELAGADGACGAAAARAALGAALIRRVLFIGSFCRLPSAPAARRAGGSSRTGLRGPAPAVTPGLPRERGWHPRAPPGTVRDGPAALRVMLHGVGASRQGKGKGIARPGSSVGTSKAQPRAGSGHSQSRGAAAAHVWGIRASKPRAGCSSLEHGMQAHPVSKQHLHPLTF